MSYEFYPRFARILNAGQSRSILVTGNIYDLYFDGSEYVPLIRFLAKKTKPSNLIQIVYELNSPIRVLCDPGQEVETKTKLFQSWVGWKTGKSWNDIQIEDAREIGNARAVGAEPSRKKGTIVETLSAEFKKNWLDSAGNAALALEFLRQLTLCSRSNSLKENLLIFVEGSDMILPSGNGSMANLSDVQLRRIQIVQDWLSDPAFVNGHDTLVLVAESRSLMHERIAKMPQLIDVDVEAPDVDRRQHYIDTFLSAAKIDKNYKIWEGPGTLAQSTAGLSIYALRQLLLGGIYSEKPLSVETVIDKVEDFIQSQVGEDVVEFKRPTHKISDLRGNTKLKKFIREEVIPGFSDGTYNAVIVSGPVGVGKTYIWETVPAELGNPVLVLKNLRSQWFGQTDVIFERLRRVIFALYRVTIFIDEADTQFGGLGSDVHETERRLTGKIQSMMSDPSLRGVVNWILMTARIHRLSADIKREGRGGDLIIPVLDPEGADRLEFIQWALEPVKVRWQSDNADVSITQLQDLLDKSLAKGYSAGAFELLRSYLKSRKWKQPLTVEMVMESISDLIPPNIGLVREYQILQALANCTRRSLLPDNEANGDIQTARSKWDKRIRELEAEGIN